MAGGACLVCSPEDPIEANSWSDYPAEIWPAPDLLFRWPRPPPIVTGQVALVALLSGNSAAKLLWGLNKARSDGED